MRLAPRWGTTIPIPGTLPGSILGTLAGKLLHYETHSLPHSLSHCLSLSIPILATCFALYFCAASTNVCRAFCRVQTQPRHRRPVSLFAFRREAWQGQPCACCSIHLNVANVFLWQIEAAADAESERHKSPCQTLACAFSDYLPMHTHTQTHTYLYIFTYVQVYVCVSAGVSLCVCVCAAGGLADTAPLSAELDCKKL